MLKTLQSLSKEEIQSIFPGATLARLLYQSGMTILDLAMKLKVFQSEKQAQQQIQAGGFRVNQCKRTNIDEILLHGDHILTNHMSLIRIGKKRYVIVDWM